MSYESKYNIPGARTESITNRETGETEFISKGVSIGRDPAENFDMKGDPVIKISDLKALVAETESYSDFVAAIEAL